jgi:hypothetical protein
MIQSVGHDMMPIPTKVEAGLDSPPPKWSY